MTFQCLSSYPTVTVINYMLLARKRTGLSVWWYEPFLITWCYLDHLNCVIYQLGLQRSRDDAIFVFISKSVMTWMRMLMTCVKILQRMEMRASYIEISPGFLIRALSGFSNLIHCLPQQVLHKYFWICVLMNIISHNSLGIKCYWEI